MAIELKNLIEDSLGADSKIPRHRCGHLPIQDPGNDKTAAGSGVRP